MPKFARIIGGAGTGKTTHLMGILAEWLERGWATPERVGFVSFTRAARREAAERAAGVSKVSVDDLEQHGWFRTIHSICYRQLGIGKELLADTKPDREWIAQALGLEASPDPGSDDEGFHAISEGATDADNALSLWHVARSRLEPLDVVHAEVAEQNEFAPDLEFCRDVVDRYEQHKRLDGRCDFTDILGRFAGVRFSVSGISECAPEGHGPELPIWFLDEWQDASALINRVAGRLVESAQWVYLAGDPNQSIYGFAGSHPRWFLGWPADRERILSQSHRCGAEIHEVGQEILRGCTDYVDRGMQPAGHAGSVESAIMQADWVEEVSPLDDWLLVARSNSHAKRLATALDRRGIPWVPTRGHGGKWAAPVRRAACLAMITLENGHPITAAEWGSCLKQLPSKTDGAEVLAHGAKAAWSKRGVPGTDLRDIDSIADWGAGPGFSEAVRSGRWVNLIDNGGDFRDAWRRWGHHAVLEPRVRIGTIHSVKGAEADNVALLTTASRQVTKSRETDEGRNEELRIAYVGVTRARHRLLVLNEKCLHRMEVPV